MKVDLDDAEAGSAPPTRAKHIGKRALKNKSVTVSFDEKDLKDFVTGFHKRKKKRRKEAQKQQEEAMRRKCIEARKKRKLEELMVAGHVEGGEDGEVGEDGEDEEAEPDASTSGTTMYDTGELKVTVTTSEISREEDEPIRRDKTQSTESSSTAKASTKHPVPVRKTKSMKQNKKHRSSTKTMKKRDKKKQARGIKSR